MPRLTATKTNTEPAIGHQTSRRPNSHLMPRAVRDPGLHHLGPRTYFIEKEKVVSTQLWGPQQVLHGLKRVWQAEVPCVDALLARPVTPCTGSPHVWMVSFSHSDSDALHRVPTRGRLSSFCLGSDTQGCSPQHTHGLAVLT